MEWKIKFIKKNYIFSIVKFVTDKSKLKDYEKNHPLDICIDDVTTFWESAKPTRYTQQSMENATQYKIQSNQYGSVRIMCVFL